MSPELLAILGCPLHDDRPPLDERGDYLVCTVCGSGFAIENGIPDLLPEDAITPADLKERMHVN